MACLSERHCLQDNDAHLKCVAYCVRSAERRSVFLFAAPVLMEHFCRIVSGKYSAFFIVFFLWRKKHL